MKIFWNNNSSPFRKFIVYITIILLIGLKLAIIHWLNKSWGSTKESFYACIFYSRHNLSGQRTKWIVKIFILYNLSIFYNFFFYILFFSVRLLIFNFIFYFISNLIFYLRRNYISLYNIFKYKNYSNHWLIT
jgi:hypothetical protein